VEYPGGGRCGRHMLDTAAPATDLLASRSVLKLNNTARRFMDLVISADGRVLIGTPGSPDEPFGVVQGQPTTLGDVVAFSVRTGRPEFLYRPRPPQALDTLTDCLDPMWVSSSGRQALLACASNSRAGRLSTSVLLLGKPGANRLRQLEAVAHNDLVAFGT
jgi:hypothetical protein